MRIHVLESRKVQSVQIRLALKGLTGEVLPPEKGALDVAVIMPGTEAWQERVPDRAVLAVLTARPTVVQASSSLLLGAMAYLPLDAKPDRIARALKRISRGQLHIGPETAAAFATFLEFDALDPSDTDLRFALRLASRGWSWPIAAGEVGLDPFEAATVLRTHLVRLRSWSGRLESEPAA